MNLPLHPMIVHFPIALIFTALFLDGVGFVFKKENLRAAGFITLCLAVIGGLAAIATGVLAHSNLKSHTEALHEIVELHEHLAITAIVLAFASLAVRFLAEKITAKEALLKKLALVLLVSAAIVVGGVGYLGGKMVFEYGAGTKSEGIILPSNLDLNLKGQAPDQPKIDQKHDHSDWH